MKLPFAFAIMALLSCSCAAVAQTFPAPQSVLPCITRDATHSVGLCLATPDNSLTGHSGGWGGNDAIYVAGYWNSGDGGDGVFVRSGTSCTVNNGTIVKDAAGNCWYRQNTNGDLRQWGITKGSKYDVDTSGISSSSDAFVLLSTLAIPTLTSGGITNLSFSQVNTYVGSKLDIPSTTSIGCGATGGAQMSSPPTATSSQGFLKRPGTIYLKHGAFVHFQNGQDSSVIQGCLILPAWLKDTTSSVCSGGVTGFQYPPQQYGDLEAIRSNMIICDDVAIVWDSSAGGTSRDVWAYGFNNPFYFYKAGQMNLTNSAADGNVCYYTVLGGGQTRLKGAYCGVVLTQKTPRNPSGNNNCYQNDSSHSNNDVVCNSEYWQIANIIASPTTNSYGRNNCQIWMVQGQNTNSWTPAPGFYDIQHTGTLLRKAPPTGKTGAVGDPINYPMWIANLTSGYPVAGSPNTGAISCLGHGPFAISLAGTGTIVGGPYNGMPYQAIDLLESEFGMNDGTTNNEMTAVTTWDSCARALCPIRIVTGDVDAMEVGEIVKSGIPGGAPHIAAVVRNAKGVDSTDGYVAEIFVDMTLSATSADTTIHISSDTNGMQKFTPTTPACDDAAAGQCAFIHTGIRTFAGSGATNPVISGVLDAGDASAALPESGTHAYAAGYLDNGTAGLVLNDAFSFGHHYAHVVQDAESTVMTNRASDGNGELDDLGEASYVVNGQSKATAAQGGKGGKSGVGIINNIYSLDDQTGTITQIGTGPTGSLPSGLNTNNAGWPVTVGSTAMFPTDLGTGVTGGKGTAGICQSFSGGACTTAKEYITYEITSGTQFLVTSRGQYFTVAPSTSYTTGAFLFPLSISHPDFCSSISSSTAGITAAGGNVFENVGGCLQLVNFYEPEMKGAFIGANATHTSISNSDLDNLTFVFENTSALGTLSGCGNFLLVPMAWNCSAGHASAAPAMFDTLLDQSATIWPCDASGRTVVLTIPAGSTVSGAKYEIKKIDASTNACIVEMSGSDSVDGLNTYVLTAQNQDVTLTNVNGSATWYTGNVPLPIFPLAHGQVYMSYIQSAPTTGLPGLQLCPFNGAGLIVNGGLLSVPASCIYMANSSTSNSNLNYIYVNNGSKNVGNVASDGGLVQVATVSPTPYSVNDQVFATCYGITGTTEANISSLATMKTDASHFDLQGSTFVHSWTGGGQCTLLGLVPKTTGHATGANGVEIQAGNPAYTLVGAAYVGASHSINDSLTKRDVISWFNRQPKKMLFSLGMSPATTTSTTFKTPNTTLVEGEFVAFGPTAGNTAPAAVQWSIIGGESVNTGTFTGSIGTCFGTSSPGTNHACTGTVEAEFAPPVPLSTSNSPFAVSGSTTDLTEGRNFMDLLMSTTGGTLSLQQTATFMDAYLLQ